MHVNQKHCQAPPCPHDDFLGILPVVTKYACLLFRNWPPSDREDAIAETVARAFVTFISLKHQGRNPFEFPSKIAVRSVQRVRDGRHVGQAANSRDLLSRKSRLQREIDVQRVGEWQDALVDNTQTPIPDQVSFRCDFPAWLSTLTRRDCRIALRLARGDSPSEVAKRFGVSGGRVSQLRRELCDSWRVYQGEVVAGTA